MSDHDETKCGFNCNDAGGRSPEEVDAVEDVLCGAAPDRVSSEATDTCANCGHPAHDHHPTNGCYAGTSRNVCGCATFECSEDHDATGNPCPRTADAPPHTCRRTRGPKDGDSEEYCAGCRYQGAKEREAEWLRPRSAEATATPYQATVCPKCGLAKQALTDCRSCGYLSPNEAHPAPKRTCAACGAAISKPYRVCTECEKTGMHGRNPKCRGCGETLLPENAWMVDGCPCNSPRGVNDPVEHAFGVALKHLFDARRRIEDGDDYLDDGPVANAVRDGIAWIRRARDGYRENPRRERATPDDEKRRTEVRAELTAIVVDAAREYIAKSEDTDAIEEDDDARAEAHEAWWKLRAALDALKEGP